jgi:uncharacterized membrane protein YfcA
VDILLLSLGFFAVALLYAAAGFGGGSSYLALLSLSGLPVGSMRPLALVCNLLVTGQASLRYGRAGVIPWRRALPLVGVSMPAAFLGGRTELPREAYLLLLGLLLLLAGALMVLYRQRSEPLGADVPIAIGTISIGIGGTVGFVSGVVGIGGGIFLSPILFLTGWAAARQIAATTSLFIALNSVAGLVGQWSVGLSLSGQLAWPLALSVLLGGWLGTRLTLRWLSAIRIRWIAAALILLVGGRLVWQYHSYLLP